VCARGHADVGRDLPVMKPNIYFDHYRSAKDYDGSPMQIGKVGAATLYKASDERSGAPVVLTLLPVDKIAEETRTNFEKQAEATLFLDHVNIVRTVAFGREGDDYAFISEFPRGETLKAWVDENGPMSPDAVLRVALQVVSALGAASFDGVVHRGISPANIVIVSGQTAEGGWPAVKLLNFPIAGMTRGEETPEASEFASPEQLGTGTMDFRSEIYSLGGTMCYLLTGSVYTAEPRSLQTKRFAKPLRRLITPMLRQNPQDRPQDPMMVAQELRSSLQQVERRQTLARRFGIPFVPVTTRRIRVPKPARPKSILAAAFERPTPAEPVSLPLARTRRFWPRGLAVAAILLAAATVAAMLLPAPVSMILHRNRDVATIGVPVGVAQTTSSTPGTSTQSEPPVAPSGAEPPGLGPNELTSGRANPPTRNTSEVAPIRSGTPSAQVVSNQPPAPPTPPATAPITVGATANREVSTAANASSSTGQTASDHFSATEPPAPAEDHSNGSDGATSPKLPPHVAARSEAESPDNSAEDRTSKRDDDEQADAGASHGGSKNKSPNTTTRHRAVAQVRRALPVEPFSPNDEPRYGRRGSFRAEFAGLTPEGGIVLRFPNGQMAVVPPPPGEYIPGQHHPRRARRVIIERGIMVAPPPPPSAPVFPPDA
jgi:serine/threonine protein kinase